MLNESFFRENKDGKFIQMEKEENLENYMASVVFNIF